MKRILIIIALLIGGCLASSGQEFEYKTFKAEDGTELNYRLLRPSESAKGQKFPLILFLHGLGERGTDNESQLKWGGQMFLNPVNIEKYPAYVLCPQCPETAFWAYKDIPASFTDLKAEEVMPAPFKAVKEMIDTYLACPDIDRSRVYIIGLSMGGMATYDMVVRFPEIFAAAIPICGSVEPSRL
ncbi:MAG: prolyl oligopeptidase family serine peptidase, partial [Bacteroidales bacterium]|nr:prolyl oligopeptidase family serine peptidase [Bacteroidales bacterium]